MPAPETNYEERLWIEVVPCLLTVFDRYCHLYILCPLRQLFISSDSFKLFSSPQRTHVTFFAKRDKLELAFWLLCSVHAVVQVPPDGVVGSCDCRCHSFAACTVDVTVCFSRRTVSVLRASPGASHVILYSRHPAYCILPILVRKLAFGVFPATAIPIVSFSAMGFFCHSDTSPA